jgi:C-3',4' desaturase CrtD
MTARIVIIGAGIGGLTTGALLAQAGYDVTVLERHTYPGGSAGTFYHQGYRFDAGATVAGGFQANGPHTLVGEKLGIKWPVHLSETAWTVHLPDRNVTVTRDRADVIDKFPASKHFWDDQARAADLCWAMAASGLPWPPSSLAEAIQLVRTGVRYLPNDLRLLPLLFTTTRQWMSRYGLATDRAFVRFIDAQLLISAQTTSQHANALYSATALDLARQGVVDVEGGMGGLAQTLAKRIQDFGGQLLFRKQAVATQVENGKATGVWVQPGRRTTSREFFPCDCLIANVTPWSLDHLLGEESPTSLQKEVRQRRYGAGAFSIHLGVNATMLSAASVDHHQIVTEMEGPLGEGRSIFVSISPKWDEHRAPLGHRAVTVTTHTDVQPWWEMRDDVAYEERKEAYTERIIDAVDAHLPGFRRSIVLLLSGTPITYHYYTGRYLGMVGGFPQTSLFNARGPQTGIANIKLVGDSIFPGQSTAAVTLGAMRVAKAIMQKQQKE